MRSRLLVVAFAVLAAAPAFADVVVVPSLSGVTVIISGTTPVSGGGSATTQVCYNQGGFIKCGDTGFVYNETTDSVALGGTVRGGNGAANGAVFGPTADTQTGMFFATNFINFTISGGYHWNFNVSGSIADLQLGNATQVAWSSTDPPTGGDGDTGLARAAAGVVRPTNGSTTGAGWIQNFSGDLALAADLPNATSTYANTNLSATVISGRTYSFELNLMVADSTAADGVKIDFNGGAAGATNFRVSCQMTNAVGSTVAWTAAVATALATTLNVGAMTDTAQHAIRCIGTLVPSSSGTFIVRGAQNAHTTGTVTFFRGSALNIRDVNPL